MGIPKFYRWISERYPCLSETVKDYMIPEFDNLYLDMNGIVHVCSHPDDGNPHFRITEEKIFSDIFHYIEVLFRMIKPKKVFFMAIDGVAPRAKMNQQRGRRFRSAREAEDLVRKALEKGEILPKQERFDSNCITPGTEFMVRLQEQLKYFVAKKISTDRLWQGVNIYLSGHETPGEGEHKVMDFIRHMKSKPDHDPNTRHCLYGLDADLMMLGLSSHEPHFSLLREEVRFGSKESKKRTITAEETTFHLLHLSLMREYIEYEFSPLKNNLPFKYDLECIIDDFIMMSFLVGNDFIPHLPNLHIHSDALPFLWKTYIKVMPTLDGYINESGKLSLPRFESFLKVLAQHDIDSFSEQFADIKWLESKLGGKAVNEELQNKKAPKRDFKQLPTANQFMELKDIEDGEMLAAAEPKQEENDASVEEETEEIDLSEGENEESLFQAEFKLHKNHYYMDKMEYKKVTNDVLREQAEGYVKAIQWNLHYYFDGVKSWGWYYPHHYAPHISDIKDFSDMKIVLEMGTPFLPFQQLMAVLPAASKNLLPAPYQRLMTEEASPIIDYYPVEFSTDLNGKRQEWEAVVLIPFIEEKRLLAAMDMMTSQLSASESDRNKHGPCLLYTFTSEQQQPVSSTVGAFPDINPNYAVCSEIGIDAFNVEPSQLRKGLCPGVKQDVFFPGFPTLKHISHKSRLAKESVKVFQMSSRGENMILQIQPENKPDIDEVAQDYLGFGVHVEWPHLIQAKVVTVSSDTLRYVVSEEEVDGKKTEIIDEHKMKDSDKSTWHREVSRITETYHDRKGVDVGTTHILIHALPMVGRKYVLGNHGRITLEKQWAKHPVPYVHQATIKDLSVKDPTFTEFKTVEELYPVGSDVFMLGSPHYGCMGKVLEVDAKNDGRVKVDFTITQEPEFDSTIRKQGAYGDKYLPGWGIAQKLGISSHLVSRITGTIYIKRGNKNSTSEQKFNIGLNLKFNKTNKEVPGYTKKSFDGWVYSSKTTQILHDYIAKFPDLFNALSCSSDDLFEEDVFSKEPTRMDTLIEFVKNVPCSKVEPMDFGSDVLNDLIIKDIEREVDRVKELNRKKKKHVKMQVRLHLLFRPLDAQMTLVPDPSVTFSMFDRVLNVRDGYSVPLGYRGTVIGIFAGKKEQDAMYEVVFDEEFLGGLTLRCSPNRGYRLPYFALINLSHGDRKEQSRAGVSKRPTVAVVKPQSQGFTQGYNQNQGYTQAGGYQARQENTRSADRNWRDHSSEQQQDFRDSGRHQQHQPHRRLDWNQADRRGQGQSDWRPQDQNQGQRDWRDQQRDFRGPGQAWPQQGQKDLRDQGQRDFRGHEWREQQRESKEQSQSHRGEMPLAHGTPEKDQERGSNQEFNAIWKQLQSSEKAPLSTGFQTTPSFRPQYGQQQSENIKVLTKESKSGDNLSQESQSKAIDSLQKIDVNSLFSAAAGHEVKSTASDTQSKSPENEFSTILKSLAISEDKQSKEGTAALKEMLNLENKNQSNNNAQTLKEASTSQAKAVGRQLSVQELFDGASQHQQQSSEPVSIQKTKDSQQRMQQQQPPQQQGKQPGMKPYHQRNVPELFQFCQNTGMPPPRFEYQHVHGKGTMAYVTLANGKRYQGSLARNAEQAMESVAGIALINLKSMNQNRMNRGPQGGIMTSPNSAFTRVNPQQGMPGPMPFNPQHPPPGMQPIRGQMQGAYSQLRATHGNVHNDPQSEDKGQAQQGAESLKNPFIPLQVARKQKTPSKGSSKEMVKDVMSDLAPEMENKQQHGNHRSPRNNEGSFTSGTKTSTAKTPDTKTPDVKKTDAKSGPTPKRTRSRLAAKFSNT